MMRIFDNFKKIEEEDLIEKEPISEQSIKDLINLMKVAYEMNCLFDVTFKLKDGNFVITSQAFEDIEFCKKTKNTEPNLFITYNNALLIYNVTIQLNDIIGVIFNLTFCAEDGE